MFITTHRTEACRELQSDHAINDLKRQMIRAPEYPDAAADGLTLYVVHGLLHICGYDDLTDDEKAIM